MRRKFYLLAFVAIIAFIGFVSTDSGDAYVCGDANSDGMLNVSDAVFIINYVFIGGPAPDPYCCDACPSTVTDYDGNVYQTVLIGGQCWMKENLKVTHYRNGDPIPNVTDDGEWLDLETGAYCNYNNDEGYVAEYGRLYNWHAVVDARGIAPAGWHVPSDEEYKQLEMYLGMSQADAYAEDWRGTDEGGKLKESGTTHWQSPNTGATNASGFSARPAGWRFASFFDMGVGARFWTNTEGPAYNGWERLLRYDYSQIRRTTPQKRHGLSVRCVRDLKKISGRADYICGDANGDGALNVSDAVFIINYVFIGGAAPDPNCCPDYSPTVTDYDGNVYHTVFIYGRWWMAENLGVEHYRNGDEIFCWDYAYNPDIGAIYGKLYDWSAIDDSRGIAPEGWHVPTASEWAELIDYLGGNDVAGAKMKEAGIEHWCSGNSGTNESGLSAWGGGWRSGSNGGCYGLASDGVYWSSTETSTDNARTIWLGCGDENVTPNYNDFKINGYSVRCVKDY